MTPKLFSIDGYFIDDQTEFSGYLVTEYDETPEVMDDDDIFFYGLSEKDIRNAIKTKEPVADLLSIIRPLFLSFLIL